MAREEKINPNAQAPELIKKVIEELEWVQDDLARTLGLSQQAVSRYQAGKVFREQYRVLNTLAYILANKLPPPPSNPEEVFDGTDGSTTGGNADKGKSSAETKNARALPTRGRAKKKRQTRRR